MKHELINIILGLTAFILFAIVQAFVINGIKETMGDGMIFNELSKKIEKLVGAYLFKAIGSCIKCMASFWGAITFWPVIIYLFGFHWQEIPMFIADCFVVLVINWKIYKSL